MTPQLARACRNAVHVVAPDGQTYRAGRAALYILKAIGWPAPIVTLLRLPPLVWLVEVGYRLVANNRPFLSAYLFTNMSIDPAAVGEGPDGP